MQYVLTAPLIITSRLMPGIRVGDGTVHAEVYSFEPDGRANLRYVIDYPGGEYIRADVSVGPMYADDPTAIVREGIRTVLSFLSAEAEQYAGSGQMGTAVPADGWLFSAEVAEWAYLNSDEISMAEIELDEEN